MKLITAMRLRAMSNTEKEKRLDELNQKHKSPSPINLSKTIRKKWKNGNG
jgi:hypothetical protein